MPHRTLLCILIGLVASSLHDDPRAQPPAASPAPTAADFVASQSRAGKKPNLLIHEKSPYLLQHAFNPVEWHPWGEEAFSRARRENRLIFLSVGYSTCYWCHVMEREVFEDEETAALMNRHFVNVKVDREERPDVDRIYMSALLTLTGSGGWPMSLFLTPDLHPFFGGSYIPRDRFRDLIFRIQKGWNTEPEKIRESGRALTEFLRRSMSVPRGALAPDVALLKQGFEQLRREYDAGYGGFGAGPKFPRPAALIFLFHQYSRFGNRDALRMAQETLRRMSSGGIYDHLGGGFHRYSVDRQWRVPHFEKMLYDQAQLVLALVDAYQITRDREFALTARETLAYVKRFMTHPEGGFYSAEDAESAPDASQPYQKREGAFYVWTKEEIERALGKERSELFCHAYGVEEGGNALEDPQGVFSSRNILYRARSTEEMVTRFRRPVAEIERVLSEDRARLLQERSRRARPHLDDKVLASWNGLMISAFARAYQVLEEPAYLVAASQAASFIKKNLYDGGSRQLLRRYREGEARFQGTLEDYALLTQGLLDLYEASLDISWLHWAVDLAEAQNSLFLDTRDGGFFDSAATDSALLFRTKEDHDGAEPAGNSVAIGNLLRLAQMTGRPQFREHAERGLAAFGARLKNNPQSMPQLLSALDFHIDKPVEVIIAGSPLREDVHAILRVVHERYMPNKIILLADGGPGQEFLSRDLSFLRAVRRIGGKATAYICQDYACKLPTNDPAVVRKLLAERRQF